MLTKPSDATGARLHQARSDLEAIEEELIAHAATKGQASESRATFSSWSAEHDSKTVERERLSLLVETLEAEFGRAASAAAAAEFRKRYAAKGAANAKLAVRIKQDLAKANALYLGVARAVVLSEIEDSEINSALPDDLEPIVTADFLARGQYSSEPEEIDRTEVWLWVKETNLDFVVDQERVVDRGNGKGVLDQQLLANLVAGRVPDGRCVKAQFWEIRVRPGQDYQRPIPLWQFRLLSSDQPRVIDLSDVRYPREALARLDRLERAEEQSESFDVIRRRTGKIWSE